jgi:hypothetical protein
VVRVVQPDANNLAARGKRLLELDDAEIDGFAGSNERLGGRAQRASPLAIRLSRVPG